MTNQGKKVVAGFYRLRDIDRDEVFEEIQKFWMADYTEKEHLRENLEERAAVVLGPLDPHRCPCCGR